MTDDVASLELRVEGMGCRRCIREVTARLRDIAGVHTLSADVDRSVVRLTGTFATAEIVTALAGSPYGVTWTVETRDRDSGRHERIE